MTIIETVVIAPFNCTIHAFEPADKLLSIGISYNATITGTIAITARV